MQVSSFFLTAQESQDALHEASAPTVKGVVLPPSRTLDGCIEPRVP
jgi:hypothetical protein